MEHLIFDADSPDEFKSAFSASSLSMDWASKTELLDFISPMTQWLGFNHDDLARSRLPDYPKTANFDDSYLWNAKFRESRATFANLPGDEIARQVAAFFQAWFFFGLLESVIEKKIEASYFVRQNQLYTRNLHFCLQSKVIAVRTEPQTKDRVNRDIQLDLRLVHRWIDRFTAWSHPSFKSKVEADYPGLLKHLNGIIPAIIRLAEAVEQMRLYALPDLESMGTLSWQYSFGALEIRRQSLKTLGWCPFQIKFLEDTVNHSTMDWVVATRLEQDPVGHETCTETSCARNNIDNNTYEQAHVCEEAQCQKLKPSLSEVRAILERDEIPVVRLEKEGNMDRLAVTAISKTNPEQFVAISHVWADGLGGKTEKGLNKCQVQRVSALCSNVHEIQGQAWFWLDCLCIPRDCKKEIYYRALDSIKDVYKCASSVLVLDKIIERCSVSSQTEFLYAHIYLSAWMQRMWTYEEAVLSRELVFALRDGLHKYKVDTWPAMRRTVSVVWQSLATQLFRLRAGSKYLTIGHIYQAFRYRLCNVPQDEFISVAGMLGMDTMELLKKEGQERTKDFWLMLQWVPSDVVFLDGLRLSIPKFSWAPRTLMHPSRTTLDTKVGGDKVECTENGLVGRYLAVQFQPTLVGTSKHTGSIFYIWINGADNSIEAQGDHRALLRVYCTETWPSEAASFTLVILPNIFESVMKQGQWAPGAALHDEGHVDQDGQPFVNLDPGFRYVGRVLVERIKNEELVQKDATAMFEGTSRIVVDAKGNWIMKQVRII